MKHLRLTFKLLRKHKLYASLRKCDFYEDRISYLGHLILDKRISGDPKNIEAMMSWPSPRKLTDVIYFVGLAGYCKKFPKEYFAGKIESMYGLGKTAGELVVP